MQESFNIFSSSGSYRVVVGSDLVSSVLDQKPEAVVLVDSYLENQLPASVKKRIVVRAVEGNKALERMPEIITQLKDLGANRDSHLIAIGGGIIQDVATFAASIYMRGIVWTYMPTTLLGMVDSCVGGKSSINVLGYKNLVGNFYPPSEVVIDVNFLKSLNVEQITGGLYEAVKICYARGYPQFAEYLNKNPSTQMDARAAQEIILYVLQTKKWFIETDEFDQKERLLLNYGHTFGHALEAATEFGVSHGIAVGIGVLVACEYARNRNWLSQHGKGRVANLISHIKNLLGHGSVGVIKSIPEVDLALVIDKFNSDKKHCTDHYRIVVPKGDGELELVSEPRTDAVRADIVSAYKAVLGNIGW